MREALMTALLALLVVFAAVEVIYATFWRRDVYTLRDSVSSISLGVGQQAINIYLGASLLLIYTFVHERFGVLPVSMDVWWHWALLVPAIDLCYYTGHRAMHRINFFVAGHVVHHQALDYSYVSAFRQGWTAWIVVFPFFVPLALVGVPLEMFVVGQLGIMFLQFFAHNGTFRGRLGPLEGVFQTPANHRVHHGINAPYRNQNYGGMFVIWDRVFGTYAELDPKVPVRLGSGIPTNFHDPFEANLDYYRRILFVMRRRDTLWGKLSIWLESPRALIDACREHDYEATTRREALVRGPLDLRDAVWTVALLSFAVALLFVHRLGYEEASSLTRLATGASVLGALWVLGRLLTRPAPSEAAGRSEVSAR